MSTSYGLYCVDCKISSTFGMQYYNNTLLAHLAKVSLEIKTVLDTEGGNLSLTILGWQDDGKGSLTDWLCMHAGHTMHIMNEYGTEYTLDGEDV